MSKLVVILGVTGNQGGSVAERFLADPNYRVRGVTRSLSSPAAQSLISRGVELVIADLNDVSSLIPAFRGANLIFSVTNYWEPFFRPDCRAAAEAQGITCRKYAYDVEYAQGKNIADAAAEIVDGLDDNGFIVSTLSSAKKCSGGRIEEAYHFDSKADVFPEYVEQKWPALAAKMSCVHTGYFMTSFRLAPDAYFGKMPDGTFLTTFPMSPEKPVPHLDVNADTGNFVYAVSKMPPGKAYMCAGTSATWSEYSKLWSTVTGVSCSFKQIALEDMIERSPDKAVGKEIGDMFVYSSDPGYDGGMELLWADDLRKAGIDCPMTTLEDFMRRQDWSEVLNK